MNHSTYICYENEKIVRRNLPISLNPCPSACTPSLLYILLTILYIFPPFLPLTNRPLPLPAAFHPSPLLSTHSHRSLPSSNHSIPLPSALHRSQSYSIPSLRSHPFAFYSFQLISAPRCGLLPFPIATQRHYPSFALKAYAPLSIPTHRLAPFSSFSTPTLRSLSLECKIIAGYNVYCTSVWPFHVGCNIIWGVRHHKCSSVVSTIQGGSR